MFTIKSELRQADMATAQPFALAQPFAQAQPYAQAQLVERRARYRRGWLAEWLAVALLVARGYRILACRYRSPFGEIDIIARRRRRLAFVEVKRRPTLDEAEAALGPTQAERIGRAAEHFMGRHRRYRDHEMGMDVVLVAPGVWPRYQANAFHAAWDAWKRR